MSWIIVNSLYVVAEIPVARKAFSGNSTFAAIIGAEETPIAVSVHGMSFTLMAKKAGQG